MRHKVLLACVALLLLVAGLGSWLMMRRNSGADAPLLDTTAEPRDASTFAGRDTNPQKEVVHNKESEAANELLGSLAKIYGTRPTVAPIEKILRESKQPEERRSALTELLNVRFDRSDAIALLRLALADSSTAVRVRAAELLYTLGSADGKSALLEVVRAGIAPDTTHLSASVNAAKILNQFRETIPADLLLQLYEEHPHPGLLATMAMQGDYRYFPILAEALEASPMAGNILNLGILGDPKGYTAVKEIFDSTTFDRNKVAAAWALFRTGGDREALTFVLDRAARGVTQSKPADAKLIDAAADARRALYVTRDDTVRDFLRQAVSTPADDVASTSFASLFYVQQDYNYVDTIVRDYFSGAASYPAIDPVLMWRVAAIRGTPAIKDAARTKNPEAYRYYFVQLDGRTADGWIWSYLSKIPMRF